MNPTEPRTMPEPELRIDLKCPSCGFEWHAAQVLPGSWWGRGVTPGKIASICWCPRCSATPPMLIERKR